jgi:hypothetical protein
MTKTHWIVTLAVAAAIAPGAFAQSAMSDSHMTDHMGKMGKMSSSALDRHMYDGLTREELRTAHHLFDRLSKSDRAFLKQEIHERAIMAASADSDHMADKMSENKMDGDKMSSDKMSGDKMSGSKMESPEVRYNKIYAGFFEPEKTVFDKLLANCEKWHKDHMGKI